MNCKWLISWSWKLEIPNRLQEKICNYIAKHKRSLVWKYIQFLLLLRLALLWEPTPWTMCTFIVFCIFLECVNSHMQMSSFFNFLARQKALHPLIPCRPSFQISSCPWNEYPRSSSMVIFLANLSPRSFRTCDGTCCNVNRKFSETMQ